jgi:hypothetical protein
VPVFGRWRKNKQRGDVHDLDRENDPRGGVQDPEYRHAGPEQIVESDGVAMTGPGGAAEDGLSPDERHERDRS